MEKRSGFRECPRCGLRNKPSVAQCDFCGWQFDESQDEWIDQIRALESISADKSTLAVDEELSKRIEATIIKPDEVSVDDFVGEQDRSFVASSGPTRPPELVSPPPPPEERKEVLEVQPPSSVLPEPEHVPEAVSEPGLTSTRAETENAVVTEFVESMIGEVVVEEIKEPDEPELAPEPPEVAAPTTKEETIVEKKAITEAMPMAAGLDLRTAAVPVAVLVSGVAAYLGVLLFSVVQPVNWTIGWTVSIVGAIMVTVGCSRLYDVWKHPGEARPGPGGGGEEPRAMRGDKDSEVLICPVCNEMVSENDDHCPNCGAEFEGLRS